MGLIVTITDTDNEDSQCYRYDEANMTKILTSDALKIARVIVSHEKLEDVLSIKD